jgi:hypothetical protein
MDVSTAQRIAKVCDDIKDFLIEKNEQYGDAYAAPLQVFSNASAEERIRCRLDEKINRLYAGKNNTEDTELDIIGLLIHLKIRRDIRDGR